MVVSEITGAFTIPYGVSVGVRFWSIINETGLWTIPFALAMCTAFVKARQGGEDEGSPALMAYKLVEKAFISMFLIMYLFVLPVDKKEPVEIEYKQYSCRGDYASILGRSANSTNVQPNLPQSLSIHEPVLPVGWGVVHEVTTGLTQTAIAKMPCDAGINQVQHLMGTVDLSAKDIKLNHSNREFGKKCYEPAATKLSAAIKTKKYNSGLPLEPEQKYFFSKELIAAYTGSLGLNSNDLTLLIRKDQWIGNLNSSEQTASDDTVLAIRCVNAQSQLKAANARELSKEFPDEVDLAIVSETAYRNTSGQWETSTTVENKYNHQMFLDTHYNTSSIFNNSLDPNFDNDAQTASKMEEIGLRIVTLASELEKRIENHAFSYMGPVLLSCLIALIYLGTPILLMLSGYSAKMVAATFYTIFFLNFSYFIIDIAWYIENILLTLSLSEFSASNSEVEVSYIFSFIQALVLPTVFGVWSLFGSFVGIQVIPVLSGLLGTMAGAVGQGGMVVPGFAVKVFSSFMTGGASLALGKAMGALKGRSK